MTEPDSERNSTSANAHDTVDDRANAPIRRSRWAALNRTNRIAAIILGGVAAVFLAALIFGAGLMVGTEFGDSDRHHHDSETSDYRDGGDEHASDEHHGDGGNDANSDESEGYSRDDGDQSDSGQQTPPEQPKP